jgi:hypothetical protein
MSSILKDVKAAFLLRLITGSLAILTTASAWPAIAIDQVVSTDRSTANTSIVSPAFSTTINGELLLAFISTDAVSSGITVSSVIGASLTWALVQRTNAQMGTAEIWRAFAPGTLSNVKVTASLSQSVAASITVVTFSGIDSSGTNGSGAVGATASGNAASGSPSATLVTTRNNSWVFGVGNDWDEAVSRSLPAGQAMVHQYLATIGDSYWVQEESTPTPLSGTPVTVNDTSPTSDRYNLSLVEILPPAGTVPDTTPPSVSITSPVNNSYTAGTINLSASATDNVAVANVQFLLDGNNFGAAVKTSPYTISWDTTTAGFGMHTLGAIATDTSNNQGTANTISVTVDNTAPAVSLSAPASGASLQGTVTASATASDDTSVAGVQFLLDGVNLGAEVTSAPFSISWDTSASSNGNHSLSAKARDLAGNTATASAVSVAVNNAVAAGLSIDATASGDQSAASSTISTNALSTHAGNELLLAFVCADGISKTTVKSVSGAGLTWNLVVRTNVQGGTSEIWRSFAGSAISNTTVTATLAQAAAASITVVTFTGVDASGANGSGAIGAIGSTSYVQGAPAGGLIATRNGSWVLGVANDYDNAKARTLGPNQALIHQYLTTTGDTYWVQRQIGPTSTSGTLVNINDTAPNSDQFNMSIVEVLPAAPTPSPTPPSVTIAAPVPNAVLSDKSTLSARASGSFSIANVQFLLDGVNLGAPLTTSPYEITWDTTKASGGNHTVSAIATDVQGQTSAPAPVTVTVDNTGNPAVVGSWSSAVSTPYVAINMVLLNTGKLFFFGFSGAPPVVWDYVNSTFSSYNIGYDLWCAGQTPLPDGRILIAGGHGSTTLGIAKALMFNPASPGLTTLPNMAYPRWYPTETVLPDGRIIAISGETTDTSHIAAIPEIYTPSANTWTQVTAASNPIQTYPFIYVMPDGRLIHVGGSEYATDTEVLDPATWTWSLVDGRILEGGSSSMYLPNKFMKAGSASETDNGVGPSANSTFVLDMTNPVPAWQQTPSMAYPRSYLNLTTLPDGTVLATGGELDKAGGDTTQAVYAAELWSPQTQTWSTMSAMSVPRLYHSTALLLPDGRVVTSGTGGTTGVPDELTAQFFSPPYLFKGARPTVIQAPTQIHYGSTFSVATPDAANIASVSMIKTGAVTHAFDQDARYIPLTFTQASGGLTVTAPANANLAPPGYYMLFLVNGNGVPAVAPIIQLGP